MSDKLKSIIFPFLIALMMIWVLSRPLSSFALWVYKYTGGTVNALATNIKLTKQEAADLLGAQQKAYRLELVNKDLKVQNQMLSAQVEKLNVLQDKLDFIDSFSYDIALAKIIGRSPDTWHKQIIISKGTNDGITLGKGVLSEKGIIGQVVKVNASSAIVQLAFNPDWRMGVKIARLNQYGVLNGSYPGPADLQFITVDSAVEVGDEILTSGICIDPNNCPYPENFPVGKVVSVKKDPEIVNLVVKVAFNEDLGDLREVFVLK